MDKQYFLHVNEDWCGTCKKVPIKIININKENLFPVKFKYKETGYDDLIFLARLSEISC